MTTTGIYKIENLKNNLVYIGQSVNIKKRWAKHLSTSQNSNDKSYNNPLYRAIRKYGLENFSFEIIEECSINELNEKEKYWIAYYNSFFKGYNLTLGGDGSGTKEKKEKIISVIKDLETTSLTQKEISLKNSISEEMVQGINTGRYWKYNREYPIRQPKKNIQYFCVDCGKPVYKESLRCLECEKKHRIIPLEKMPITREELKNLIRTTPFTKIAANFGVSDNAIRKWCIKFNLPSKSREIKKYSEEEWDLI